MTSFLIPFVKKLVCKIYYDFYFKIRHDKEESNELTTMPKVGPNNTWTQITSSK